MHSSSFSTCGLCGGTTDDSGRAGNGMYVGRCDCSKLAGLRKPVAYRNPRVLAHAQTIEDCTGCGRWCEPGSIVAAHSNQGKHGKAGARKADDCFVAYLGPCCHPLVDEARTSQELATYIWDRAHERSVPLFSHLLDAHGLQKIERGRA